MSPIFKLLCLLFFGASLVHAIPVPEPPQVPWISPLCEEPVRSSNASEWTSMEEIARRLPNPLNEIPMYWSGRVKGASIIHMADRCAAKLGAKTIGMLMCELGGFVMPNTPTAQTGMVGSVLWDYASELFANYTSGPAYVVLGEAFRPNGTFFHVELPALRKNPNVKSVIQANRDTCAIECYRYCPNRKDCLGLNPCPEPKRIEGPTEDGFILS